MLTSNAASSYLSPLQCFAETCNPLFWIKNIFSKFSQFIPYFWIFLCSPLQLSATNLFLILFFCLSCRNIFLPSPRPLFIAGFYFYSLLFFYVFALPSNPVSEERAKNVLQKLFLLAMISGLCWWVPTQKRSLSHVTIFLAKHSYPKAWLARNGPMPSSKLNRITIFLSSGWLMRMLFLCWAPAFRSKEKSRKNCEYETVQTHQHQPKLVTFFSLPFGFLFSFISFRCVASNDWHSFLSSSKYNQINIW